jgi:hypothetical protein
MGGDWRLHAHKRTDHVRCEIAVRVLTRCVCVCVCVCARTVYNGTWCMGAREGQGNLVAYSNRYDGEWRGDQVGVGEGMYLDHTHAL